MTSRCIAGRLLRCVLFILALCAHAWAGAAAARGGTVSAWPQGYGIQRDEAAGLLTLSTPYYSIQHDLKRGGAISSVRLLHGRATNLLVQPLATRIVDAQGTSFTDLRDSNAQVTYETNGEVVTVIARSRLLDEQHRVSDVSVKTVFAHHWGYIKIHKEFAATSERTAVREVCPVDTVLAPSLTNFGYREGLSETEGAPPFSFGSNRWGKLRSDGASSPAVRTNYLPRSVLFADPGVEGLEWFEGSDLAPWDVELAGRRGQGDFRIQSSPNSSGVRFSVSPLLHRDNTVPLPKTFALGFYVAFPLLEGHAFRPWLHTSFSRNHGQWVSPEQFQHWAASGIQTVHNHNDGDYYDDGLFWRDGAYPPYPDMDRFDKVIADCHRAGLRMATYFSNKELHPSTPEFQAHGQAWGRMDSKSRLQHNFFRPTNEFGAQMCLRSGWLEFLKFSIDRVLKNHALDGVYYDWNVALYCCNPEHEGKKPGARASGHWDIDELLNLMEWTRRRVGPSGLVIVHNTTTPMFATENFADDVVANEWGYGTWKEDGPSLDQLPLEWSLVGARPRGVISYGQLNAQSPKHLYRLFALEALFAGVTPFPASPETFQLFSILKPLGDLERYRFADWRNQAVTVTGTRCAAAVYSRADESYILLGNESHTSQEVRCVVHPSRLPYPLAGLRAADGVAPEPVPSLDVNELTGAGVKLTIPADSALLMRIR